MKNKANYKPLKNYFKYSGMAFQMGIIIAGGTYGGVKLDQWLNTKPIFILICSLSSIVIALYLVLKDFTSNHKSK